MRFFSNPQAFLFFSIESIFSHAGFPDEFLAEFDQLECLAFHHGRETFLVEKKGTHQLFVAKCYDAALFKALDSESILGNLRHEGLPAHYGTYRNDAMFVVVRSFVKGVPLNEYAGCRELSQADVVRLCIKLADILIYLHGQTPPIIHRDIKPENIIVAEDESLFLIDFDIARTLKAAKESDTTFFGTKGYAPPEDDERVYTLRLQDDGVVTLTFDRIPEAPVFRFDPVEPKQ